MRSLEEHRAAALQLAAPLPAVVVALADALGLVLAQDVTTDAPLPRWDNSAMDGYAVRAEDVRDASPSTPVTLRVVADLPAGSSHRPTVGPGTAARIMTGAPVPAGADAIVPVEDTDAGTVTVRVGAPKVVGQHVRRAGEDAVPGDLVVAAGTLLGPAHVAAVASVGVAEVAVHRRPRVAVVSTGDELVAPGKPLAHGQIPDSNSWLLAAAVRDAGGEALRLGPVGDDPVALRDLLHGLDGTVDAIVTSGGVSVGAFDVVKAALLHEPDVAFVPVAVQPGKPQGLGRLPGGTPVFTLPGNPVSSFVSFELFVRPALLRMRGLVEVERPTTTAVVVDGWRTPPARAQVMPVRFVAPESDGRHVDTVPPAHGQRTDEHATSAPRHPRVVRATAGGSGSHLVARLAVAEGLAVVPAEIEQVAPGDLVTVLRITP
ncbi:molybdopterin molybdotransferase MoeA [Cellulomonas fimi]|nr:molybdopterin molybdotransferase MoeA [Cellulomonas fimi]